MELLIGCLVRSHIFALLALCAATVFAADTDSLDAISARLKAHATGRAQFVQTRNMPDLERPQFARGRLVWSPAAVIWTIEQPFRTTYVMREDGTLEIGSDGSRTLRSSRDEPAGGRVARVLRALLRGDTQGLAEMFEIDARLQQDRWNITLVPRRSPLTLYLKTVRVSGSAFVEAVRIDDTNGNTTQLQFSNHHAGELSEEELGLMVGR